MKEINGRIIRKRDHGQMVFMDLKNQSGVYQISIKKEVLDGKYRGIREDIHIGDIISVTGVNYFTHSGQATLEVEGYRSLTKCQLPYRVRNRPPLELRRIRRGLDLLTGLQEFQDFMKGIRIPRIVRQYLYEQGFEEVDTGILSQTTDSSKARSFQTQPNWKNRSLYLRKSTEQRLKQLLMGGLENIFEMGQVFRNESSGRTFVPEFTVLELYKSYGDYKDILKLARGCYKD